MSILDKLRTTQGVTERHNFKPTRLKVKDGKFFFYNKEKGVNVEITKPIKNAVYLGEANQLSSFSPKLGNKGGSYNSAYYLKNDKISLYSGSSLVTVGTKEEIAAYLNKVGADSPSVKKIIFLITETSLLAVETNMSLAIDQLTKSRNALAKNFIDLTPVVYSAQDQSISAKTHQLLGPLAAKNPPSFVRIDVKEELSEDVSSWVIGDLTFEQIIDEFNKFKEGLSLQTEQPENKEVKESQPSQPDKVETPSYLESFSEEDDLPFPWN